MRIQAYVGKCAAAAAVAFALLGSGVASATALVDGGFENGPPPASGWTYSGNIGCGADAKWAGDFYWGGPAPYSGSKDFWAGGYCSRSPMSDSAAQTLTITSGDTSLYFHYLAFRPDPDDELLDLAYVSVNGTNVWTLALTRANDTLDWTKITVDLGAYAGQSVSLRFGVASNGDTGNVRFDAIGFGTGVPAPGTLALLGLGLAGLAAAGRRRRA